MIYLISKIFVYLLLSLGLGAAGGWLWRHLLAAAREEALERQLLEARSRLSQLESALRDHEQQILDFRSQDDAALPERPPIAPAEVVVDRSALRRLKAVEAELATARAERETSDRALAAEQRRVEELSRERELQNRSLAALEQQLEMAREERQARIANG